jgi:hypothetical protein
LGLGIHDYLLIRDCKKLLSELNDQGPDEY